MEPIDKQNTINQIKNTEPMRGFEPPTYSLRENCSTPELHRLYINRPQPLIIQPQKLMLH